MKTNFNKHVQIYVNNIDHSGNVILDKYDTVKYEDTAYPAYLFDDYSDELCPVCVVDSDEYYSAYYDSICISGYFTTEPMEVSKLIELRMNNACRQFENAKRKYDDEVDKFKKRERVLNNIKIEKEK